MGGFNVIGKSSQGNHEMQRENQIQNMYNISVGKWMAIRNHGRLLFKSDKPTSPKIYRPSEEPPLLMSICPVHHMAGAETVKNYQLRTRELPTSSAPALCQSEHAWHVQAKSRATMKRILSKLNPCKREQRKNLKPLNVTTEGSSEM